MRYGGSENTFFAFLFNGDNQQTVGAKRMKFARSHITQTYTYLHITLEVLFVCQQFQTWRRCETEVI
jgi:hypothetical protein